MKKCETIKPFLSWQTRKTVWLGFVIESTVDLQRTRDAAKFVSRLLTLERRENALRIYQDLKNSSDDPNFLTKKKISSQVTRRDEFTSRIRKRKSSRLKTKCSPRPTKTRQAISNGKAKPIMSSLILKVLSSNDLYPRDKQIDRVLC